MSRKRLNLYGTNIAKTSQYVRVRESSRRHVLSAAKRGLHIKWLASEKSGQRLAAEMALKKRSARKNVNPTTFKTGRGPSLFQTGGSVRAR